MAAKSLTATPAGIQQINRALTDLGWSREDLAKKCDCSRQPAINFASGKKAVSKKLFVSFCNALELDWETVAGLKADVVVETSPDATPDIANLVQTIRAQVYADIQDRCGKMRVLDMEQPIGLGDIYTSVNILKKLSKNQRPPRGEWLKHDPENFDRFLLGQVHQPRIPGLQAVEEHRQLMILGKPGAGKTTFMKRLAILCNGGEFQPQRVPVFVTLKEYAEAEGKPKLQTYIQNQWKTCGVKEADALAAILDSGDALLLLDGLDEVRETDHDRILQDIKTFTQQFRDCQCVITCRIAAREYIFETFTEVEVADFNEEQIAEFATKWFAAKQDPKKAETFIQRLEDNEPIQELATNPLLLTLLCLVFGEAADFPANRAELYKEGLDVLLKKWDGKRNIERDQVYKKLSLKRKEDLLSQLAFATFERGDYFFKQATVESHIIQYIRNLPGANEDEEALQLDGESVLKSIEAQHGLLVERARGIYSFSHLTFQEYFTAQYIVSPTPALNQALQNLATHITEKRYREIFLLAAGMLPEANTLLLLMKRQIDQIMQEKPTEDPKLQAILIWTQQKADSVNASYKPAAIRALYLGLISHHPIDLSFTIDLSLTQSLPTIHTFPFPLGRALTLPIDLIIDLILIRDHALIFSHDYDLTHTIAEDLNQARKYAVNDFQLKLKIQELRAELLLQNDREVFEQWWLTNSKNWAQRLRGYLKSIN